MTTYKSPYKHTFRTILVSIIMVCCSALVLSSCGASHENSSHNAISHNDHADKKTTGISRDELNKIVQVATDQQPYADHDLEDNDDIIVTIIGAADDKKTGEAHEKKLLSWFHSRIWKAWYWNTSDSHNYEQAIVQGVTSMLQAPVKAIVINRLSLVTQSIRQALMRARHQGLPVVLLDPQCPQPLTLPVSVILYSHDKWKNEQEAAKNKTTLTEDCATPMVGDRVKDNKADKTSHSSNANSAHSSKDVIDPQKYRIAREEMVVRARSTDINNFFLTIINKEPHSTIMYTEFFS